MSVWLWTWSSPLHLIGLQPASPTSRRPFSAILRRLQHEADIFAVTLSTEHGTVAVAVSRAARMNQKPISHRFPVERPTRVRVVRECLEVSRHQIGGRFGPASVIEPKSLACQGQHGQIHGGVVARLPAAGTQRRPEILAKGKQVDLFDQAPVLTRNTISILFQCGPLFGSRPLGELDQPRRMSEVKRLVFTDRAPRRNDGWEAAR